MASIRKFCRQTFEWLSHIHTAVWLLESVGMGALISLTVASAERLLKSPVSWISIVAGFLISSALIYGSLWLKRLDSSTKSEALLSHKRSHDIFVKALSEIGPAGEESIIVTDGAATALPISGCCCRN